MVETGTLPNGITTEDGTICRDFILHERTFRNTLELANDPDIDKKQLGSTVYYDAAIISKRLKVAGVGKLTPDMVLNLDGDDGDTLANAMMTLDQRREEFRKTLSAPKKTADSPA